MHKVAVINQKGGVGKTTTTVNLGAALAERGQRVLLIDLDPQGNLGTHLGIDTNTVQPTIYDVLVSSEPLSKVLFPVAGDDRLQVVPSNIDLSAAEMELVSMMGRETLLRDALEVLETELPDRFDVVLMDCPPSLGVLSVNALAAAQDVLVPLQAEFFALQGMAKLTEIVSLVQRRLNPELNLRGIVACKVDRRTRLTQEVLQEVERFFGDKLLKTMIRPNVKLAEAPSYGQTVLGYASDSNGAADYRLLAREWCGEAIEDEVEEEGEEGYEYEYVYEYVEDEASAGAEEPAAADAVDAPAAAPFTETLSSAAMLARLAPIALPACDVALSAPAPQKPPAAVREETASAPARPRPATFLSDPQVMGSLVARELPPHCGAAVRPRSLEANALAIGTTHGF